MYHRQYTGGPLGDLSQDRGFPSGRSPANVSWPMSGEDWREANRALAESLAEISLGQYYRLRTLAENIAIGITLLDPMFDRYCLICYPRCDEVCCEKAEVHYHFTDLLFIHVLGIEPPPYQTRSKPGELCRYLSLKGCVLPRVVRPYLCTWYMCDLHLECFFAERPREQRRILSLMERIRRDKEQLAKEYTWALEASGD